MCRPACKTKAEIKCMGSAGGKTPTEPNLFIYFFSLSLGTLNKIKLCYMIYLFMSGKIKRLSI